MPIPPTLRGRYSRIQIDIERELREAEGPATRPRYTEAEKEAMTPWQRQEAQERIMREWLDKRQIKGAAA